MQTGLYLCTPEEYECQYENIEIIKGEAESFADYLHGGCEVFAITLNNMFVYPLYTLLDDYGDFIHAFCMVNIYGVPHFVDARGITDDFSQFFEEYEDFASYPTYVRNNLDHICTTKSDIERAAQFIRERLDYYKIIV